MNKPPINRTDENCAELTISSVVNLISGQNASTSACIQASTAGLVLHDGAGRVVDVDERACEVFGRKRNDLIQKLMADLDLDFPRPFIEKLWQTRAVESAAMRYGRLKSSAGELVPVQIRLLSFRQNDNGYFLLGLRIVSDQQRIEAVLASSENQLRAVVDAEPECVKLVSRDGILLEMNPAGLKMVEADSPEDAIGKEIAELVHIDDRETFVQVNQRAFEGESGVAEFRITGFKGTKRWMETHVSPLRGDDGEVTAALSITRDITERKESDAIVLKLLEGTAGALGRNFFRGLVKAMAELLDVSFAFVGETLAQPNSEEHTAPSIRTICCWKDGDFCDDFDYAVAGTPCEFVFDGEMCHYESGIVEMFPEDVMLRGMSAESYLGIPLRCEAGNVIGALVAIDRKPMPHRDRSKAVFRIFAARASSELNRIVTSRHEKELERQLHQVQRMESIGTLAGGIAHDFNNIVCAIMANAEMAMLDLTPDHPAHESVEGIVKSTKRASSLVSQIMMFSRHQTPVRAPVSLSSTVVEATKMMRSMIPANVELSCEVDSEAHNVLADTNQIHQVIVNLCTNAWHAIGLESGSVKVSLSRVEVERPVLTAGRQLRTGNYVLLQVSDDGQGMDEETQRRIYDPFYTTKEAGQGIGLGLSVVHGIVDVHDGRIAVTSEVGVGSTFSIHLPIVSDLESLTPISSIREINGAGRRVLCIDDEASILDVTERMLKRFGFSVTSVSDPERAVDGFEQAPGDFHMVLVDYFMPRMTGLDVVRRIHGLRGDIPIVLSSGNIDERTKRAAREEGVTGFLDKPYSTAELTDVVRKVLKPLA